MTTLVDSLCYATPYSVYTPNEPSWSLTCMNLKANRKSSNSHPWKAWPLTEISRRKAAIVALASTLVQTSPWLKYQGLPRICHPPLCKQMKVEKKLETDKSWEKKNWKLMKVGRTTPCCCSSFRETLQNKQLQETNFSLSYFSCYTLPLLIQFSLQWQWAICWQYAPTLFRSATPFVSTATEWIFQFEQIY